MTDAYDRTLEPPEEEQKQWVIECEITRTYCYDFYGTEQEAMEQAKSAKAEYKRRNWDFKDETITSDYHESEE